MENPSDDHEPGSDITDSLEEVTLRFAQLGVDDDDENNQHEASHAQSSYTSYHRYTQPRVSQTTNTISDVIAWPQVEPSNAENGTANNNNKWNLGPSKTTREVVIASRTPQGSRYLQAMLSKGKESREVIFNGVYEFMFEFLIHQFGTHVFARLVELCDNYQLLLIVEKLSSVDRELFVEVVCDRFGANSIKKLIKVLEESPLVLVITSLLARDITTLMKNRISSYIIIKCFETLGIQQNRQLFIATIRNCLELATDENACLALNESMTHFKQPYRDYLFQVISSQARYLSQDPSGNYAVQEVLGYYHPYFTNEIYNLLRRDIVKLSTKKSSSLVVEKCLLTEEGVNMVIEEFIKCDKLWKVARDPNGNYVIQKALDMAKGIHNYEAFVEKLYKDRHLFQQGINGVHVYSKLMNLYPCAEEM